MGVILCPHVTSVNAMLRMAFLDPGYAYAGHINDQECRFGKASEYQRRPIRCPSPPYADHCHKVAEHGSHPPHDTAWRDQTLREFQTTSNAK